MNQALTDRGARVRSRTGKFFDSQHQPQATMSLVMMVA
jgi:hypothetical protein